MESASLITGGNTNAIDSSSELSGAEFNAGGERSSRAISHAVPPIIASLCIIHPSPTSSTASHPRGNISNPIVADLPELLLQVCLLSGDPLPGRALGVEVRLVDLDLRLQQQQQV